MAAVVAAAQPRQARGGRAPALYLLRVKHPHVPRPYRVPGGNGVALLVSAVTWLWAALASVSLLWPGFMTSTDVSKWDESLPESFAGQRMAYEVSQLVPLAIFILIGVLFYAAGAPTRRQQVRISIADEHVIGPDEVDLRGQGTRSQER